MRSLLLSALLLTASLTALAGKKEAAPPPVPTTPEGMFADCATCHGEFAEGKQETRAPRLAGQQPWYLQRQLEAFRGKSRGAGAGDTEGHLMVDHAARLPSPQAVTEIVAYIGTLHALTPPDTIEGDSRNGRTVYEICAKCHGELGEGNEATNAPRLAGQHDWYLYAQIQKFKDGIRGSNPNDYYGQTMSHQAEGLEEDQAVKDVLAWIDKFE